MKRLEAMNALCGFQRTETNGPIFVLILSLMRTHKKGDAEYTCYLDRYHALCYDYNVVFAYVNLGFRLSNALLFHVADKI